MRSPPKAWLLKCHLGSSFLFAQASPLPSPACFPSDHAASLARFLFSMQIVMIVFYSNSERKKLLAKFELVTISSTVVVHELACLPCILK